MSAVLAGALKRAHRVAPRAAGHVWTNVFTDTRALGTPQDDLCPLGARRVALTGVPRVASAYVWGGAEPTVLALHGWGTDSTTMSPVVAAAVDGGESVVCFDGPAHGVSPGTHATMRDYADAVHGVLQRFCSVTTVVAHSFAAIAGAAAVAEGSGVNVRSMLLLAPPCSLTHVLDRWAATHELPADLVDLVRRELRRRDGMEVRYWDLRTLALPPSVRVRILHDAIDPVVPVQDAYDIAGRTGAELTVTLPGVGHHRILSSDDMRLALTAAVH